MPWKYLKHFDKDEAWGSPDRMNGMLLLLLDAVRDRFGDAGFVIHCGFDSSGHVSDSEHKRGNAVDFHIEASTLSFADQISRLEMILDELQVLDRVGLGVYPDWNNPGFHLDVRGSSARWGRIGSQYVGWSAVMDYVKKREARS